MNETVRKSLEQVVEESGRYPIEAFEFVRLGLNHTVKQIHGSSDAKPEDNFHVSGQQLCQGLRQFAVSRYGLLSKVVLNHWNIHKTGDFGRIVFIMIDNKLMQKTDQDDIRDFENVFDFRKAFEPPERPVCKPTVSFRL
jgi:uncharacterized repeat protein (TIGR04138 family)